MGIEPTSSAWKAEVLPLNYTRPSQNQTASESRDPHLPTCPAHSLLVAFADQRPDPVFAHHRREQRGGGGRIRTYEGVSRQIYSLLPLAAWVPLRLNEPRILISAPGGVNADGAPLARRAPGRKTCGGAGLEVVVAVARPIQAGRRTRRQPHYKVCPAGRGGADRPAGRSGQPAALGRAEAPGTAGICKWPRQPGPRTTRPGRAPVSWPSRRASWPLTITCSTPVANWWGSA